MKKLITVSVLVFLFNCIAFLFWHFEWQYNLPTPKPTNNKVVNIGDKIELSFNVSNLSNKPTFLHFFNPSCPCSKFNLPHFKALAKKYQESINFYIIISNNSTPYTASDLQKKLDVNIPIIIDSTIANNCGVYSTPQAVLINNNTLYYKGNYNRSRYCIDQKSNYAQIAIQSLLSNISNPTINQNALIAYGCAMPICKK
jgi:thiol-disulfide isomerase/thioredoxin